MTRFARAKGSKASNERREEEATPWHVMRQQLAEQLSNQGAPSETDTAYNLKELLRKEDNSQKAEVWSDFGEPKPNFKGNLKDRTKKDKSNKNFKESKTALNNTNSPVETVPTGGNDPNKDANRKINGEESMNVFENKGMLKKRKQKNGKTLSLNNNSLYKETAETIVGVKGNKFIVETVEESNSAHKRNIQEDNNKSEFKSNLKRQKLDDKKNEDASSNSNVSKKEKNKILKAKNNLTEIPPDSKDNFVSSQSPTENFTSSLKNSRKSVESGNSLSEKKSKKNNKLSIGKEQNNINEIPKLKERISSPLNNPHDQNKSSESENIGYTTSAKQKHVDYSTRNNESFSNSYNNQYRNNNYSRAHNNGFQTIIANGREIHIVQYQGFFVKKDDAEELKKLRKKLKAQNIPKDKLEHIMKLERRKAEKALAREKKKVCYHCRQFGHNFSDCPDIKESDMVKTGVCFKCGSLEHSHFECKVLQHQEFRHAVCFVCKEQGHIARQCPLNSQGLYPKGGSCHLCGEVTHLRKDCPKAVEEKTSKSVTVGTLKDGTVEDISGVSLQRKETETQKKVIKFK